MKCLSLQPRVRRKLQTTEKKLSRIFNSNTIVINGEGIILNDSQVVGLVYILVLDRTIRLKPIRLIGILLLKAIRLESRFSAYFENRLGYLGLIILT